MMGDCMLIESPRPLRRCPVVDVSRVSTVRRVGRVDSVPLYKVSRVPAYTVFVSKD